MLHNPLIIWAIANPYLSEVFETVMLTYKYFEVNDVIYYILDELLDQIKIYLKTTPFHGKVALD